MQGGKILSIGQATKAHTGYSTLLLTYSGQSTPLHYSTVILTLTICYLL